MKVVDNTHMSNEDTLISQLISETYTDGAEADQPNNCIDLRNYFEKRLNQVDYISIWDYLDQHDLSHESMVFHARSGCYRLNLKQSVLDFPLNWSIFKEINSSDLIYLDQSLDQDFLLDIFSEINGCIKNIALVKDNNEIQIIFLTDEESHSHLKWIRNYFEKKNARNAEIEIAA